MKKCSTHESSTLKGHCLLTPRATTLAFLRQFARVYHPVKVLGMPGIVLN